MYYTRPCYTDYFWNKSMNGEGKTYEFNGHIFYLHIVSGDDVVRLHIGPKSWREMLVMVWEVTPGELSAVAFGFNGSYDNAEAHARHQATHHMK